MTHVSITGALPKVRSALLVFPALHEKQRSEYKIRLKKRKATSL